jgi:fluoroacetyl-CoA thioesterase
MSTDLTGTKGEEKVLVTPDIAIDFMGVEDARVLSTPHLVWHLEITCRNSVAPLLPEGYDTVGTHVDIKHLAATPLGMTVTFTSEVISHNEKRLLFKVEAFDEREKVSEGTHERFIVNKARFATRVQAKRQG